MVTQEANQMELSQSLHEVLAVAGPDYKKGRSSLSFSETSPSASTTRPAQGSLNDVSNGDADDLPPSPPCVAGVEPLKAEETKMPLKARIGFGRKGQPIKLLTNHFKASLVSTEEFFYHYYINLKYEDGTPVYRKGLGRSVMEKLQAEFANKDFAYDGEASLFTIGALPLVKNEFTVVVEDVSTGKTPANGSPGNDRKRIRRPYNTKTYKIELYYASRIPMSAISQALRGQESEDTQEAIRVLHIILRQHSAKQGCLFVRQSFFHNNPNNFVDLGGGVLGCRGFHSSFRATQSGPSLNIDVSTTMIVKPGPVILFLLANQKVSEPKMIDWAKAKRALKNLRIKTCPANQEHKIVGLSDKPCCEQLFTLKLKNGNNGDFEEITVFDYFVNKHGIELEYSGDLPCINVGKPMRPTYFPLELCSLLPLQRYTKHLSTLQRSSLEKSRQKPEQRMSVLSDALQRSYYDEEPMLKACGITIARSFTEVDGRILKPPKIKAGNGEDILMRNGRWNFNNKRLIRASSVENWAVVNFSARCNVRGIVRNLIKCGGMKGIMVKEPFDVIDERPSMKRSPAERRVEDMFEQVRNKLDREPKFLLCVLAERKSSDIYGPWKKKCLAGEFGIVTQCVAPTRLTRVNDQYLTNLLLKINAKLGGMNSLLQMETSSAIPYVSKVPTVILGMNVSRGRPCYPVVPSIAAVVSSREWPLISKYRASVRTQSPKMGMIDSLFQPRENEDDGLIRECLFDFYTSSGRKPDQVIIFRAGVSKSQFNQVLNIELQQIIEACKFYDDKWNPKFTLIIAQKSHHTKFFIPGKPENVPPGTVVDNKVCHPRNFDFYMCSHAGMTGTTRPTHYHVLYDEIGFNSDNLQELVHSLSYVNQRSTTAISVVAPIYCAHLAAAQVHQFTKFDEMLQTSSSHDGHTSAGSVPVQELPHLHEKVRSSMFFC